MSHSPAPPAQALAALDAARTKRDLADRTADLRTSERANEALRRANAELAASRAALAASEARLRIALEAARMANWEWTVDGDRLTGSAGREALYGRPPGSLASTPALLATVLAEDRAQAAATIQRAMVRLPKWSSKGDYGDDGVDSVEFRVADPDGTVRWLRSQGRVTARDPLTGQALRATGVTFDITERKEAEARYEVLFDAAPFAVIVIDTGTHRVLDVNGHACAEYGYTREEFLGLSIADIDALGDGATIRARGRAGTIGPGAQEFEARHRHKSGELRDVLVRVQGIRLGGRKVTYGAHFDITARKAAEARARDSEERLATALRAAQFGVWSRDLASDVPQWDVRAREIYGWPDGEATAPDLEELVRRVHPEDRARRAAAIEAAIAAGGPDSYALEFRLRQADGRDRWVAVNGAVVKRDPGTGIARRLAGVVQDISDRKAAEHALGDAVEHLRVALDAGGLGAWEMDFGSGRAGFDARLAAVFGWPAEPAEVAVAAFEQQLHPEDRDRTLAEFRAAASGGAAFVSEFRVLRQDGSVRWLQGRGRPVQDSRRAGEPAGPEPLRRLSGVALDVTDRRRAEERQALLVREVDHRAKNALAVVQSVLRLSPRRDPAAFASAVEGRVAALARAHNLLAEGGWAGAELRVLLEAELATFLPESGVPKGVPEGVPRGDVEPAASPDGPDPRILLSGPRVVLVPYATQPLSMAVHELATNAAKYGSLSAAGGRVLLSWRVEAELLRLRWEEQGGPEVAPPARSGFGSRLVATTLSQQLGGQVRHAWQRTGLLVEADLPSAAVLVR